MGDVIQFPKKPNNRNSYYFMSSDSIDYIVSLGESLGDACDIYSSELEYIKKLSLWDRIFNWPYRK